MGVLVGAVRAKTSLDEPLAFAGGVFLLLQVLSLDPPGRDQRQPGVQDIIVAL